jgi:hypothetical protein
MRPLFGILKRGRMPPRLFLLLYGLPFDMGGEHSINYRKEIQGFYDPFKLDRRAFTILQFSL